MRVAVSASRIAYTICSSENFNRSLGPLLSQGVAKSSYSGETSSVDVHDDRASAACSAKQEMFLAACEGVWERFMKSRSTHLCVSCGLG